MLEIKNLHAGYDGREVLGGLALTLESGRIHALIGPSGCGKSTLLKVLCGIQPPTGGAVLYNGAPIIGVQGPGNASAGGGVSRRSCPAASGAFPRIGYVPQNYGLLDWKSVEQNIFLPLHIGNTRLAGPELSEAVRSAGEIIETLGLRDVLHRYPRELSGGQQQRAALARAFILRPDLLLMDEPFSALDAFTSETSRGLFLALWRRHKVTTLLITHNMHEAAALGQIILLMGERCGTPGANGQATRLCGKETLAGNASGPDFGPDSIPGSGSDSSSGLGGRVLARLENDGFEGDAPAESAVTKSAREAARRCLVARMDALLRYGMTGDGA